MIVAEPAMKSKELPFLATNLYYHHLYVFTLFLYCRVMV